MRDSGGTRTGYERVSTAEQNVETPREAPIALGAAPETISLDRGDSGHRRVQPALERVLGELRNGGRPST